jgi:iron complex outermembrane receptor protein
VFDYASGRSEVVTLAQGGNPGLLAERRQVRSLGFNIKPFAKSEWRISATYEATTIRDATGVVAALNPLTEALVPQQFQRDAGGRLIAVSYRPINLARENQRAISMTITGSGQIGKAKTPAGATDPAPRPGYYFGVGPTLKLDDQLLVRAGTTPLDLLAGDTIRGWGTPRLQGYVYGGIYYRGSGMKFSGWGQAPNRLRSSFASQDVHFSGLLKLDLGVYVGLGGVFPQSGWAKKLRLSLDVTNITDARQVVRDRFGAVPNRYQRDYLDPTGRTATITLRKLL